MHVWKLLCAGLLLCACGGRTPVSPPPDAAFVEPPRDERCDGLDNDQDKNVDEDFRDELGNYVHDAHCGACEQACEDPIANADAVGCGLLNEVPSCMALDCAVGFGVSKHGGCVPLDDRLCLICQDDGDCGTLSAASCVELAGERRCVRTCEDACPVGYACLDETFCAPVSGSCSCDSDSPDFAFACRIESSVDCAGSAQCTSGMLSECAVPAETCDTLDNDCDGSADEDFIDELGAYSRDDNNCGTCGVDCAADNSAGVVLTCGGDPFAPTCVTLCPDALDGRQIGDMFDADRAVANGCECSVTSLQDDSGIAGQILDTNCDGADGGVLDSYYVAVGGDDSGPGSYSKPLRTIGEAITRASLSLTTASPRPHVYIASGVYTETVRMRDGVLIHGGYRSDFLSLNPSDFAVIVVAPADTTALGGAALVVEEAITRPTLIEGVTFRGRDALDAGAPAIGAVLIETSQNFVLRSSSVRSGKPGAGASGEAGKVGAAPTQSARAGQTPRAAIENASNACISDSRNQVVGGSGGINVCGNSNISGGAGGSAGCPIQSGLQAAGASGVGSGSAIGGEGGEGGNDVTGPIASGGSCPGNYCCGLADFTVPPGFTLPRAGQPGDDGQAGQAGAACSDPIGEFINRAWATSSSGGAREGSSGQPGSGGGGGGAGGGAQMAYIDMECEFPDGLGGAGGGGGCGGASVGVWLTGGDVSAGNVDALAAANTFVLGNGGISGKGGGGAAPASAGFAGSAIEVLAP